MTSVVLIAVAGVLGVLVVAVVVAVVLGVFVARGVKSLRKFGGFTVLQPTLLHSFIAKRRRMRGAIGSMQIDPEDRQATMDCELATPPSPAGAQEQGLIALTCPACGAPLPPAAATEAVVCGYCNTTVAHHEAPRGPKQGEVFGVRRVDLKLVLDGGEEIPMPFDFEVALWSLRDFQPGQAVTVFSDFHLYGEVNRQEYAIEAFGFVDERAARPGEATVMSCMLGAKSDFEQARWLELALALGGDARLRATLKGFFPEPLLRWLAPGSHIPVLIDARDSRSVAVDWSKAHGAVVGAAGKVLVEASGNYYPARVGVFPRIDSGSLFCIMEGQRGEWIDVARLALPDGTPVVTPGNAAGAV